MKLPILLTTVLLLMVCVQAVTNTENEIYLNETVQTQDEKSTESCATMDFHYLELFNELYSSKVRNIKVFLDEKAFSEKNLEKLFRYLSDKNPEPRHLTIVVNTSWKQLPLPTDCPPIAISNMPARPDEFDYHKAIFYRRERGGTVEYFHYYPILKTDKYKEVIMKGKRL